MAQRARVLSVRDVEAFRAFLVKLGEGVQHGLAAGDAEVGSTQRWLRDEHPARLSAEHGKAQRARQAAVDDLRRKKFQPTATGDPASVAYEQKVAARAKAKVEWLEEKIAATQRWARVFDKENDQYLSGTQGARGVAEAVVPRAMARLDAHLKAIADYLEVQAAGGPKLDEADAAAGSVSRPAEEDAPTEDDQATDEPPASSETAEPSP